MTIHYLRSLVTAVLLLSMPKIYAKETQIQATNCELFVDRISVSYSSHASRYVTVYVKTLNDRLDGPIASVGFRSSTYQSGGGSASPWFDRPMSSFVGSPNYFEFTAPVSADYVDFIETWGAFYVKTTKGTTYWTKAADNKNVMLDRDLFNAVENIVGRASPTPSPSKAANTQVHFPKLNPQRCQ